MLETLDLLVEMELQELGVSQENVDPQELMEILVTWEKSEIKATLVELEGVVCLVHLELTALPEDQVLQELMALMETPDDLESQELWVILVLLVSQDNLDQLV